MRRICSLAAVAGLALCGNALAQVTITNPGPIVSDGPAGSGSNGSFTFNYAGPAFRIGGITFEGDATSGDVGSFLSELRYRVVDPAGNIFDSASIAAGTTWAGTTHVGPGTSVTPAAFGAEVNSVGMYAFSFWESFDDGGVDAIWSNISFTLNPWMPPVAPSNTFLGVTNGNVDINTFGSSYDTELGLYDADGALLANNDDTGGLQSQILSSLADGTYYVAVGGYNTAFASGFAVTPGSAAGDLLLAVNGLTAAATSTPNQVLWYSFTVPTPGACALMGLSGLVALRRRRA